MSYTLAQMPGKNPHGLFPQLLNRKSYFIRWMLLFVITIVIVVLFAAKLCPKEILQAWVVAGGLYSLFGLHIPRWRDTGLSPWLALLLFLSILGALILQIILFVRPSKSPQPPPLPSDVVSQPPRTTPPEPAPQTHSAYQPNIMVARALDQSNKHQRTSKPSLPPVPAQQVKKIEEINITKFPSG